MARHPAPPRRARSVSLLGGTAGSLGVAALLAAASSLGSTADYAIADQSAVGGAVAGLTSSAPSGGPLDIPSIGVVAPGLDALGLLSGAAPSSPSDPFSPALAFPGASASTTGPRFSSPTAGLNSILPTTPPSVTTPPSSPADPTDPTTDPTDPTTDPTDPTTDPTDPTTDPTDPTTDPTDPTTQPTDPTTDPTGPTTTPTDPTTETPDPTTTPPDPTTTPPPDPTTTPPDPTTPPPAAPACTAGLPGLVFDANGVPSLVDLATGAAPAVDQIGILDLVSREPITVDPATAALTVVTDPTSGAATFYALDDCVVGTETVTPVGVLVSVVPAGGSAAVQAYVPLDPSAQVTAPLPLP